MKKRSFFERLTGSVNLDEDEILDPEEEEITPKSSSRRVATPSHTSTWLEEQAGDGELSVDVYQTPDEVIVKAMIPGVRKDDVDISISRDAITIRGSRKEDRVISEQDYVVQELYWGSFSRTIRLPHEVDIEHAEASESQGVLTVKLPRVDKDRQAKLKIRSI
jgi:HSP20 family molecular chaperone IbpA